MINNDITDGEMNTSEDSFKKGFDAALNVIIKHIDYDLSNLNDEDVQGHHYLLEFKKYVESL